MDLHHLEYIIEIANMRGISKAADNLHITQSTLSQYLSKLEQELGVRLFDRRKNEMALTAAGKLYVDTCRHILQEKKELYNQLSDLSEAKTGNFSVGVTPQWGSVAYSHIIGPFSKAYPNIHVSVKEETATPLIQMLQDSQVDMAIIPLTNNAALPLESILLHAENLIVAIPRQRAASMRIAETDSGFPTVDIAELKNEPMIFSQNKTTIRKLQDQCFSARGITPNITAEINSHPASLIMVEEGLGSTFLPVSCMTPSDKILYAYTLPPVQWLVAVAFRKDFQPRQSEKYFIKLAKEYFENTKKFTAIQPEP